jgi:hypothetical protein
MGAQKDDRFDCECGAVLVYTKDCPQDRAQDPTCVCGRTMRPLGPDHSERNPSGSEEHGSPDTAIDSGQKFLMECGAKVKYLVAPSEPTQAVFRCACGASGTETRADD